MSARVASTRQVVGTAAYLTPGDVAKLLATTSSTVHRAIARGDLSALRYGRLVRIRRDDLERFLSAHSTDALTTRRRRRSA
jgi:excisionase family DNA binding protein